MNSAVIKVNVPNGIAFALITPASLEAWLKVLLVVVSIICTILVTRRQLQKKEPKQ